MVSRTPTLCRRRKKLRRWRATRAHAWLEPSCPHRPPRRWLLQHGRGRSALTQQAAWKRGEEPRSRGRDGPIWSRGEVEPRQSRDEKELRRSQERRRFRRCRGGAEADDAEGRGVEQRQSGGTGGSEESPTRSVIAAEFARRKPFASVPSLVPLDVSVCRM